MAEQVCGILVTVCLDICAGICLDFISLRHGCTENLCRCSCKIRPTEVRYEREALLSGQQAQSQQPGIQPPMQTTPQ